MNDPRFDRTFLLGRVVGHTLRPVGYAQGVDAADAIRRKLALAVAPSPAVGVDGYVVGRNRYIATAVSL